MTTAQEVLLAARQSLLGEGPVTDGWVGEGVTLVQGHLLVTFRWKKLPYLFAVRIDLDGLGEGVWTGLPVSSAEEWVDDLAGLLMEEFDTGGVAWLPRVERNGLVELDLAAPRVGQVPAGTTAEHYVSRRDVDTAWFVHDEGLDAAPAVSAADRGELLAWWVTHVNNTRARPLVAQLVVTGRGDAARLAHLEVLDDVPDAVVAEMVYLAVWAAACEGVRHISSGVDHPALGLAGLQRESDGWLWRADGPVLSPPEVLPPWRHDAQRAQLGDDDIGAWQQRLSDDVERLVAYGQQHRQSWGGLRFDGARLVASFVDPGPHRKAVAGLVQHPDRVDVVRAERSEQELERIRDAVMRVLEARPGCWLGAGSTGERVTVDLFAAGLPVAEQLWAEHGDALEITVAGHPFPLTGSPSSDLAPGTQPTAPWPEGLQAEVELDQATLRSGSQLRGHLVLRATTHVVRFDSDQPLYGELLDEQGRRRNDPSGMRVGTGWDWNLLPGESGRVAFSASTHSARLEDGPYVPAGTWSLALPIPVHTFPGGGRAATTYLVAGPFPVQLRE